MGPVTEIRIAVIRTASSVTVMLFISGLVHTDDDRLLAILLIFVKNRREFRYVLHIKYSAPVGNFGTLEKKSHDITRGIIFFLEKLRGISNDRSN